MRRGTVFHGSRAQGGRGRSWFRQGCCRPPSLNGARLIPGTLSTVQPSALKSTQSLKAVQADALGDFAFAPIVYYM